MSSPVQQLEESILIDLKVGSVPILWGPPGVGKTAFVNAIGRRLNRKTYTIIGSLCDPTDINGFPVLDDERIEDGNGRNHKVIRFAPRDFLFEIRNKHQGKALILWDEITSIGPAVQSAILTTIQTKRFGDYELDPFKVGMIAAANPADQAANGQELPGPMVNRLAHYQFPSGDTAAIEWAGRFAGYWGNPPRIGFDDEFVAESAMTWARAVIAGFIHRFPSMWHVMPKDGCSTAGWPSPRSWDRVSHKLGYARHHGISYLSVMTNIQADVGPDAAMKLQMFLKDAEIPDPEDVIANPDSYRPSGRIDVDFSTMTAVSACVVARPTPDRTYAAWIVANKVAEARGTDGVPVLEAAMVACLALGEMYRPAKLSKLYDDWWPKKDRDVEKAKYIRKIAQLTKPFQKYSHLLAELNQE